MQNTRRPLVLLHSDPVLRERVRKLAHGRFGFQPVASWSALSEALPAIDPAGVVVLDPYHQQSPHAGISPELAPLLRRFPSATVVVALHPRPGWLDHVRILGEWGTAAVLDLEAERTDWAILQGILEARGRPLRALLRHGIGLAMTGRGRAILDAAAEVAVQGGKGNDLAAQLHINRNTLLRWCKREALPLPRDLLTWMRILLAAELLDNPGQSIEPVAFACGYSFSESLSHAFVKHVGMRPGALRGREVFPVASAAFREKLHALRRETKANAAPDQPSRRAASKAPNPGS